GSALTGATPALPPLARMYRLSSQHDATGAHRLLLLPVSVSPCLRGSNSSSPPTSRHLRPDAPHAGRRRLLLLDLELADLPRVADVRPGADLLRHVADGVHRHLVAVALVEQPDRPGRLRLRRRHRPVRHLQGAVDLLLNPPLARRDLLLRHLRRVREVEAQPLARDVRALLHDVLA